MNLRLPEAKPLDPPPAAPDRLPAAAWVVLAVAALVMIWNARALPLRQAYDAEMHIGSFKANSGPSLLPQPCAGIMVYNPSLYYYLVAKLSKGLATLLPVDINTLYLARGLGVAMVLGLGWAAFTFLLPRAGLPTGRTARLWFALALFLLPNQYLLVAMPRADHLLFLSFQLLVLLWFAGDCANRLPHSRWRQAAWALLLIVMGHARLTCLAGWAPFFAWGAWVLWRQAGQAPAAMRGWHRLRCVLLLGLVTALSFSFYLIRFARTGEVAPGGHGNTYAQYKALEQTLDRRAMFLNLDFHTMLSQPNRLARYANGNNAVVPRLVNDMWADHWLYFSSTERMGDRKVRWKRVVLIAAAPFTLLYFASVVFAAVAGLGQLARGRPPTLAHLSGWIYGAALVLLLLFVNSMPEPGKNVAAKFSYLFAFNWLPFFCMAEVIKRIPGGWAWLTGYTVLLFLLCLPLSIFW
jgi:hypothetical protein